jgi:transcription initiation factor TFIIH subunit 2
MLMVEVSGSNPLTASIMKKDLKPNRLDLTLELLRLFVVEFFDQNPLGQIGIGLMRDGLSELTCELTGAVHVMLFYLPL